MFAHVRPQQCWAPRCKLSTHPSRAEETNTTPRAHPADNRGFKKGGSAVRCHSVGNLKNILLRSQTKTPKEQAGGSGSLPLPAKIPIAISA